ncbi:MAG: hypothetical protein K0Q73_6915 [Paenibacillus sp.]|nr:hypothetical protein [Paenibacillus sp.]
MYHFDRHELDHIRRADPKLHRELFAFGRKLAELDERAFLEWLWVRYTPEQLAANSTAIWSDRISLVVEDLLAMPTDSPIIAEGPGFFPEVILPLISNPQQALWMAPSEMFKRTSHMRRRKGESRAQLVDNPELAQRNHIDRDLLMAERYRQSAHELGLPLIEVDGSKSVDEVVTEVETHFGRLLQQTKEEPR